jgi:hypothetical protein
VFNGCDSFGDRRRDDIFVLVVKVLVQLAQLVLILGILLGLRDDLLAGGWCRLYWLERCT